PCDRAELVLDAAGRVRLPAEAERRVDGNQHVPHARRIADDDHASYMRGALDDPLAEPDELALAAGADRVLARAVLARDLAGACEPDRRRQLAFCDALEDRS